MNKWDFWPLFGLIVLCLVAGLVDNYKIEHMKSEIRLLDQSVRELKFDWRQVK